MTSKQASLDLARAIEVLAYLDYREGELDGFLDRVAGGFSHVLGVDWTVVTVTEGARTYRVAGDSSSGRSGPGAAIALHGSVTARVIDGGVPYWVTDVAQEAEKIEMPEGFVAYLGVPLQTATGEVIGTVCSFVRTARQFGADDVAVARVFAARAAAAIEQHRASLALAAYNGRLEEMVERRTSELRATQQQLIRRERLAAIGELSAKIVHEVRSPLSTVTMVLDHLIDLDLAESSRRRLALAQEEAGRLNRLLGEILNYATPGAGRKEWIDVDAFVAQIVADFKDASVAATDAVRVRTRLGAERLGVFANSDKLRQVLINLLSNAHDASPVGAEVAVGTGEVYDQGLVEISVRNRTTDGPLDGSRVLEPFYTTKPEGTGLGLPIVNGIVMALQGRFSIQQDAAGEVIALVILPTSAKTAGEWPVAATGG